jgi:hydroxymethylbilane synthase
MRFNDEQTALCVQIERDFLRSLMGGCSTPISALAEIVDNEIHFKGNILSVDGSQKMEIQKTCSVAEAKEAGIVWGKELLQKGADIIVESIRNFGKNS